LPHHVYKSEIAIEIISDQMSEYSFQVSDVLLTLNFFGSSFAVTFNIPNCLQPSNLRNTNSHDQENFLQFESQNVQQYASFFLK